MRLRFLGTGTSFGVPVIGCDCATCSSSDPRDRRTRHAAVLEDDDGGRRLLIDTPPDLRQQLLSAGIDRVDAVWFTHGHADHIHGIDDLRIFSTRGRAPLPAFAGPECAAVLRERFSYIFDDAYCVPDGTTKPRILLSEVGEGAAVRAAGFDLLPLEVPHGPISAYGFRVGPLAYITDAKVLPPQVLEALRGVRVLILNALWFGSPHPTHFNVEEAMEAAESVGAETTYLTHLTHRVRHQDLLDALPQHVRPAHDGLDVVVEAE